MGAHGVRPWDDDDGMDWAAELPAAGPSALREAVAKAQGPGYLEAPQGSVAIAAAEVVAAAIGHPGEGMPPELQDWLARARPVITDSEVSSALAALDRVTSEEDSELYELWMDSSDGEAWLAYTADLRLRLTRPA